MSNATPNLNTAILRGIVDKLERMNYEAINEEGESHLLAARDAIENLIELVSALKIIDEMESLEKVKDQYVPVRDRFGKVQYIPNPDIYDLELPDAVGAGTLLLPEAPSLEQRVKKWWRDNVTHPPLPPLPYVPGSSGPSRRYVRKRN